MTTMETYARPPAFAGSCSAGRPRCRTHCDQLDATAQHRGRLTTLRTEHLRNPSPVFETEQLALQARGENPVTFQSIYLMHLHTRPFKEPDSTSVEPSSKRPIVPVFQEQGSQGKHAGTKPSRTRVAAQSCQRRMEHFQQPTEIQCMARALPISSCYVTLKMAKNKANSMPLLLPFFAQNDCFYNDKPSQAAWVAFWMIKSRRACR